MRSLLPSSNQQLTVREIIDKPTMHMARVREASHGGSWYSDDEERLSLELDRWLDAVPETAPCIGPLSANEPATFPTAGARIIIAP